MPPKLNASLSSALAQFLGYGVGQLKINPVGGGSINQTLELIINNKQRFFAKVNSATRYPALFEQEVKGLKFLSDQGIFRIPLVIASGITEDLQWLILEWIEKGPCTNMFWTSFGERLAKLHTVSCDFFGLDTDNYMGALSQSNKKTAQWDQFLSTERLQPQVKLAMENGFLTREQIMPFERLYRKLGEIFPETKSSLLHGDLWSGNFICDQNSEPVLIDPAIYFGHPAMDVGMTELFGGFDNLFYQAYATNYPIPSHFIEQKEICRLYPLLIHLNLFGRSYLPAIKEIIAHY